jgi:hypothetical protein
MHAASFVAVHAAGDQHDRQRVVPMTAFDGKQWIAVRRVVEAAVFGYVEALAKGLDDADDFFHVTALHALPRQPPRDVGLAPGTSRCANGIGGFSIHA